MTILKSIITNTAARTLTEMINRLGSAVFWIFVARYLGASGLGAVAFALSLFSFFNVISSFGLGSVLVRDVAKNKKIAGSLYSHISVIGFISSIIFAALMIGLTVIINPQHDTFLASVIMAFALIPSTAFLWGRAFFTAKEKTGYIAGARAAENIFKITAGLIVLNLGGGILYVALVIAASKIVSSVLINVLVVTKVVKPVWKYNSNVIRYLLKQIPSFSFIAVFNSAFWASSIILLTEIKGEAVAGVFTAAFKLVDIGVAILAAYGQAFFPIASRTFEKRTEIFQMLLKKSIKYCITGALAAATVIYILAPHLVHLLYGETMAESVQVLRILVWLLVPFAIVPTLAFTLIVHNQQKFDLKANALAFLTLITMHFLLVPQHGAIGAAIALVGGALMFAGYEFWSVRKLVFQMDISISHIKPFINLAVMAGVVWLLKDVNMWVAAFSGLMILIATMRFTGTITDYEIHFVRQLKTF